MRVLIWLALIASVGFLAGTQVGNGERDRYQSPCIVSWDENVDASGGPSTFCILTPKAARMEHVLAKATR